MTTGDYKQLRAPHLLHLPHHLLQSLLYFTPSSLPPSLCATREIGLFNQTLLPYLTPRAREVGSGWSARSTYPTPFLKEHAAIPSLKIEPSAGPTNERSTEFNDSVRYDPEMGTNFGRRQ